MKMGPYKFSRMEFAGSLGDFGTLIPLSIALITVNGLDFSSVFLMVGFFYFATGLYYKLPIPVQPLKVVSAIAIAFPDKITPSVLAAGGLLFGIILILLTFTGIIDKCARLFTKPIIRGIQLGLGFILMIRGIGFISMPELFIGGIDPGFFPGTLSINLLVGMFSLVIVLCFLASERFPAALVVIILGIVMGLPFGSFKDAVWGLGPTPVNIFYPGANDFVTAFVFLVIPQIPLTIGNAIFGTADTAKTLFGTGKETERVSAMGFSLSMGIANIVAGIFGAMPMCHGSGGLAAHYRFGARTGGSSIMIGLFFIVLAAVFGKVGVLFLSSIPNAVLGVLLLFAGMELALLIRDLKEKQDLFITFIIAGIGIATTNMSIAFMAGIIITMILKVRDVEI